MGGDGGTAAHAIIHAEARRRFNGTTKCCNVCDEWKALDAFGPSQKGLGGVAAVCRECKRRKQRTGKPSAVQIQREWRRLNVTDSHKRCRVCRVWKRHDEYNRSSDSSHSIRNTCRECDREKHRKNYHRIASNDAAWETLSQRHLKAARKRRAAAKQQRMDDAKFYLDELLKLGLSVAAIRRMTGFHNRTVEGIRDRKVTNVAAKTVKALQEAHDTALQLREALG